MEEEQNYIVEEKSSNLVLPFIGILIFVAGGAVYYYVTYLAVNEPVVDEVVTEIEVDPFGKILTEEELAEYRSQIAGQLYFSAQKIDPESGDLGQYSTYSYDLAADNELNTVAQDLFYTEFAPIDQSNGVFLSDLEADETSPDFTHPTRLDYDTETFYFLEVPPMYFEQDLTVSPNGEYLAYSGIPYKSDDVPTDSPQLENWEVVIYNFATEENVTIPEAARPQWLNGGKDLVYLKTDGVYRYNLATKEEVKLLSEYNNLLIYNGLTVSSDSTRLILTIPDFYLIDIYEMSDSGDLSIYDRFSMSGSLFFDPIFSPDGKFYAVSSVGTGAINTETQTLEDINVEIRSPQNQSVIQTFEPSGFDFTSFKLGVWHNEAFQI